MNANIVWKDSIEKAIAENEKNVVVHENQKKMYSELYESLNYYNENISPSVMVPFCSRVIMKGNLIHTNEVLVSLGCNYFVKTSSKVARDICRRRLTIIESILHDLEKESTFLRNQISGTDEILSNISKEIIEEYDEEKESLWRIKHRENSKVARQKERDERNAMKFDKYLDKLKILELQEETEMMGKGENCRSGVEKVYLKQDDNNEHTHDDCMKRLDELQIREELESKSEEFDNKILKNDIEDSDVETNCLELADKEIKSDEENSSTFTDKFFSEKSALYERLAELESKENRKFKTEEELLKWLDINEEKEDLKDNFVRLHDKYSLHYDENDEDDFNNNANSDLENSSDSEKCDNNVNFDSENDNIKLHQTNHLTNSKIKKRVSFSDHSEKQSTSCECIQFSHSEVSSFKSNKKLSSLETPSDIYNAFPNYFVKKPKSIMKNCNKANEKKNTIHISKSELNEDNLNSELKFTKPFGESVIVGNVIEHNNETCTNQSSTLSNSQQKPISKFKSLRLAQKKASNAKLMNSS